MTSKEPYYVQVKLISDETGNEMTCWLDKPEKFKVGQFITLRGKKERWEVVCKYSTQMKKSDLHTDWEAGGL